jgi:hypothetical protein
MSVDNATVSSVLDEYVCTRETVYKDVWYSIGRKLYVPAGTAVDNCNFKAVRIVKKFKDTAQANSGK